MTFRGDEQIPFTNQRMVLGNHFTSAKQYPNYKERDNGVDILCSVTLRLHQCNRVMVCCPFSVEVVLFGVKDKGKYSPGGGGLGHSRCKPGTIYFPLTL